MTSVIIGIIIFVIGLFILGFILKHIQVIIGLLIIGAIIYYLPWWAWVIIFIIGAIAGNNEKTIKEESPPPPRPRNNSENRTPEEILGLKPPWTSEELRAAYKREAGRTHPDKWIGKPEVIRKAMEAEFKMIQEAYRNLGG